MGLCTRIINSKQLRKNFESHNLKYLFLKKHVATEIKAYLSTTYLNEYRKRLSEITRISRRLRVKSYHTLLT